MRLIHLKNYPIYQQLQLEEALLRLDDQNYCIINEGSPPAIVMGISGKFDELIDAEKLIQTPIPVIRRFSGGGTVVVNEDTLFVSFLCQNTLHPFAPYPEPILRWSADLYSQVLKLPEFALRENDYVIGPKKVGGNAQYLRKDRWLHHTTFLWNYEQNLMDLLLHPKKTPAYREGRKHNEFITSLNKYLPTKEHFIQSLKNALAKIYALEETSIYEVSSMLEEPHRRNTELLEVKLESKR